MSIKPITIFAALALGLAAPAAAADFDFLYTLNTGQMVSGSFTGDRAGNLVTNISNIAVALDGSAFDGTINAYGYAGYNGPGGPNTTAVADFVLNAATVSFDPLLNNFLFLNQPPAVGLDDDVFYIIPWDNGPGNQVATQVAGNGIPVNIFNGNYVPANWSLSEVGVPGPGVPEPATWALLLAGFGLVGVMARRRTATVTA
jgi:hypothetical protein